MFAVVLVVIFTLSSSSRAADSSLFESTRSQYITAIEQERLAVTAHRMKREEKNDKSITDRTSAQEEQLSVELNEAQRVLQDAQKSKQEALQKLNSLRKQLGTDSVAFVSEQYDLWVEQPLRIWNHMMNNVQSLSHTFGPAGVLGGALTVSFTIFVVVLLFPILVCYYSQIGMGIVVAYSSGSSMWGGFIAYIPWIGIPVTAVALWWYIVGSRFISLLLG
eukprot:PhF_6_TR4440/c0_g1_i1/m.6012